GARRGDGRPPGLSARGRKRGRRCAGGDDSAPRCRRTQRRTARSVRGRGGGGRSVAPRGLCAAEMVGADLKAYVLVGAIEAEDFALSSRADAALAAADCVISLTPYA